MVFLVVSLLIKEGNHQKDNIPASVSILVLAFLLLTDTHTLLCVGREEESKKQE